MSTSYYLRIRGVTKGPVSRIEIISLIRKKRLGRHHELSLDGINWQRAGDIDGLFESVAEKTDVADFDDPVELPAPAASIDQSPPVSSPPPLSQEDSPVTTESKACPFCGEQILSAAIKCRHCQSMLVPISTGAPVAIPRQPSGMIQPSHTPDPLLAGILSGCCIAGLGHIVIGQVTKGVFCLIGNIVFALATAGISVLITWPLMGIDAYLVARKLRSGQPVTDWESFPL